MDVEYNTETQEITVELNTPAIELDTPTGGRGLKGDKGNKGDKGDKGDTGNAATVVVGSTTTGDAGTSASVSNSGTAYAAVLDFTIPKGDKGDTGSTGQDGVSPTVSTSKSGKTTTVTFTDVNGTSTATILDGADASDEWGAITGTLSDQTDLKNALDAKADVSSLATVATSGSYNDLSNKPTIPTVNNATLTIQKNGTTVNTFTANASANATANITVPTKVSDLTNDSGFITNTVNNLTNYYTSSNTYTKTEVDTLIGAVSSLNIEVVETLPSTGISTSTIYLVPNTTHGTNNYYDEYIYVSNAWELIGSTQVDLSNYYTKTETDTLLGAKADSSSLSTVATSGSYNDLSNKPTIPDELSDLTDDSTHRLVTDTEKTTWNNKSDFSGSYNDLSNKPTIPDSTSDLTNDSGFITSTDIENKEDVILIKNSIYSIPDEGDYDNWFARQPLPASEKVKLSNLYAEFAGMTGHSSAFSSEVINKDVYLYNESESNPKRTFVAKLTSAQLNYNDPITRTNFDVMFEFAGIGDVRGEVKYRVYGQGAALGSDGSWTESCINYGFLTTELENAFLGSVFSNAEFYDQTKTYNIGDYVYCDEDGAFLLYKCNTNISTAEAWNSSHWTQVIAMNEVKNKQDTLVSGTNIKTINNTSLLGSGNIDVSGGGSNPTDVRINGTSITSNDVADIQTEGTYNSSTNKIATMDDVPSNYVTTDTTQDITGAKTLKNVLNIQNGQGTGSMWIGGDVNASTLTNNSRHLARISVPSYSNVTLASTLLGFDSSGDSDMHVTNKGSDAVSFGGMKKITNATSPMAIGFCVATERNGTAANKKVYPLEMDSSEARFNVQPNYNGTNLATVNDIPTVPTKVSDLQNDAGYITGYTETDPVYSASAAAGITSSDISNWNGKMDFTEISSNCRIWDLSTGVYKTTAQVYVYYNGSIDTTNSVRIRSGSLIFVAAETSNKAFYIMAPATSETNYIGHTSSTSGEIYDVLHSGDIVNNLTTSTTGSVLDASQGKALKDLIDGLATVASTGDYDDLLNKPTIPSVGNSKTYYGTCSTKNSTQAKVVDCTGFVLETGATIDIKFTNAQTYNGTPTLNINSTGAISITGGLKGVWNAGDVVRFVYDGSTYRFVSIPYGSTTTFGAVMLSTDLTSTATNRAATISTVHQAYNLADGKQDKITSTNKLDYSLIDNAPSLATVATSGAYSDLSGTPTIPTKVSDLQNDSGYVTTNNDIQVNGTSIVSSNVANLITNTAYDSSSNKLATMSDIPSVPVQGVQVDGVDVINSQGIAGILTTSSNYNPSTNPLISKSTLEEQTGISNDTWSSSGTYQVGQPVIYNNKLYRNKTGTNTATQPSLDGTNWENITLMDLSAPDVLYYDTSGSKTDITLSNSVSNYSYLEIFYGWETNSFGTQSTRYDMSMNGNINLSTTVLNNSYIYFGSSEWTPTGNKINLAKGEYWRGRVATQSAFTRTESNNISIYKVLGYK